MSWQMALGRGYDVPEYRDTGYSFPIDPPFVPRENPAGLYVRTFNVTEEQIKTKNYTQKIAKDIFPPCRDCGRYTHER